MCSNVDSVWHVYLQFVCMHHDYGSYLMFDIIVNVRFVYISYSDEIHQFIAIFVVLSPK